MKLNDITHARLLSHQIAGTKFKSQKEIVGWMGAMQAQDFNMAKWAIGLRLNKATHAIIDAAIDSGEIIRTHLLRPTWHFVSAEDIYWMIGLTAPRIKSSMKGRNKQLELTDKIFEKSFTIIEKTLRDGNHLTRKELVSKLNKAKIATDNNRSSHILFSAELEGIICSGKMIGKQTSYALINERIPKTKVVKKEEALFMLAKKYFESHCPATFRDFVWWSGLSVADAKHAMEMVRKDFVSEKINSEEYLFSNSFSSLKELKETVFLLPAFDEFLISYKDRTAAIVLQHQEKAFSKNGIFWPVIVIDGKVEGIWKREIKKGTLIVETIFFDPKKKKPKDILKEAAVKLGNFLGYEVELLQK